MGCEVCIGHDEGDIVEPLSENHPKARKPHKCCECGGQISPGQKYQRFVGVWEGEISRYDTCILCEEIRKVFTCGEGWMWSCLWEDMQELAFPELTTATECFRALSPAAKQFVLDRWQIWKGIKTDAR